VPFFEVNKKLFTFGPAVFATWAPNLHAYYKDRLSRLISETKHIRLKKSFASSVFAANSYNFGPATVCYMHRDFGNLPYGWCAITALGDFNPSSGGHLVLWDLGLVVRFPPGSTILIPSAVITHSNTPIAEGESRYSFTQYSAGGLFRWVEHGFQSETDFDSKLSPEGKVKAKEQKEGRWREGLALFSSITEVAQRPPLRKSIPLPCFQYLHKEI
jgi:hypothetical protein